MFKSSSDIDIILPYIIHSISTVTKWPTPIRSDLTVHVMSGYVSFSVAHERGTLLLLAPLLRYGVWYKVPKGAVPLTM